MRHAHAVSLAALFAVLAAVPAQAQEEEAVDVSGVWEISAETPRGTMTRTITFEQDGDNLTGTMETQMGSIAIENGSVDGNKITFTFVMTRGDRSMQVVYKGTVDGDTAKGTMQTPRGQIEWTGKRVKQ